jgi:hypothetical protein
MTAAPALPTADLRILNDSDSPASAIIVRHTDGVYWYDEHDAVYAACAGGTGGGFTRLQVGDVRIAVENGIPLDEALYWLVDILICKSRIMHLVSTAELFQHSINRSRGKHAIRG